MINGKCFLFYNIMYRYTWLFLDRILILVDTKWDAITINTIFALGGGKWWCTCIVTFHWIGIKYLFFSLRKFNITWNNAYILIILQENAETDQNIPPPVGTNGFKSRPGSLMSKSDSTYSAVSTASESGKNGVMMRPGSIKTHHGILSKQESTGSALSQGSAASSGAGQ